MFYLIPSPAISYPQQGCKARSYYITPPTPSSKQLTVSHEDDLVVRLSVDLPGVKPDEISVNYFDGQLTVHCGKRNVHGVYSLDPASFLVKDIQVQLQDGVLTITAPKVPKPEPVEIPVDATTEATGSLETPITVLTWDLPGAKAEDVSVTVRDGYAVHVQGVRRRGTFQSSFHRVSHLDASGLDISQLSASLVDGVLTLRAPRVDPPEPVQVPVSVTPSENTPDEDAYHFTVDLPGVRAEDVSLQVESQKDSNSKPLLLLTMSATRQQKPWTRRVVVLDERVVDARQLRASLVDGVLTVTAPRKPRAEPRILEIQYTGASTTTKPNNEPAVEAAVETPASSPDAAEWEELETENCSNDNDDKN